jgi:hypothetical protein
MYDICIYLEDRNVETNINSKYKYEKLVWHKLADSRYIETAK